MIFMYQICHNLFDIDGTLFFHIPRRRDIIINCLSILPAVNPDPTF